MSERKGALVEPLVYIRSQNTVAPGLTGECESEYTLSAAGSASSCKLDDDIEALQATKVYEEPINWRKVCSDLHVSQAAFVRAKNHLGYEFDYVDPSKSLITPECANNISSWVVQAEEQGLISRRGKNAQRSNSDA